MPNNQPSSSVASAPVADQTVYIHKSLVATGTGVWDPSQSTNAGGLNLLTGLETYVIQSHRRYVLENPNGTNNTFYLLKSPWTITADHTQVDCRPGTFLVAGNYMGTMVLFSGDLGAKPATQLNGAAVRFAATGKWSFDGSNKATTCVKIQNTPYSVFEGFSFANATNGAIITADNFSTCRLWNTDYLLFGYPVTTVDYGVTFTLETSNSFFNSPPNPLTSYYTRMEDCQIERCGLSGVVFYGVEAVNFTGGNIAANGTRVGTNLATVADAVFHVANAPGYVTNRACNDIHFDSLDMESPLLTYCILADAGALIRSTFSRITANSGFAVNGVLLNSGCVQNTFDGGMWTGQVTDKAGHNRYKDGSFQFDILGTGRGTAKIDNQYIAGQLKYVNSSETLTGIAKANNPSVLFSGNDLSGTVLTNVGTLGTGGNGSASSSIVTGAVSICAADAGKSFGFNGTTYAQIASAPFEALTGNWTIAFAIQAATNAVQTSILERASGSLSWILLNIGAGNSAVNSGSAAGRWVWTLFDSAGGNQNMYADDTVRISDGKTHTCVLTHTVNGGTRTFFHCTDGILPSGQTLNAPSSTTYSNVANVTMGLAKTSFWTGATYTMKYFQVIPEAVSTDWITKFDDAVRKGL